MQKKDSAKAEDDLHGAALDLCAPLRMLKIAPYGAIADDGKFKKLRCEVNPQSKANTDIVIVDKVVIVTDPATIVDRGGKVLIIVVRLA